jgi:predicted RNase H-like HicB family nuclease
MTYRVSIIIEKEDSWYVALCPDLDIASQGKTIEEATKNLKEALELYLKHADPSEIDLPKEHLLVSALDIAI